MAENTTRLPRFDSPPVVETVISLQFKPIKGFKNAHLWSFWSSLRKNYPKTEDQEPIEPRAELFGDDYPRKPQLPRLSIHKPASRLQMISDDEHRMLQLQNGRFVTNWRSLTGAPCPSWEATYAEFLDRLALFRRFLSDAGLGELQPNQWEVTYVNHIHQGEIWQTPEQWSEVVPGVLGSYSAVSGAGLQAVDSTLIMLLSDDQGRLYVDLKSGFKADDPAQELLILTLTARGPVGEQEGYQTGLELGHRTIVSTFAEITGQEAQTSWRRMR